MDIYATYSMVEAGLGISMNNQVNSHLWNGTVKHLPLKPEQIVEIGLAYGGQLPPAAEIYPGADAGIMQIDIGLET